MTTYRDLAVRIVNAVEGVWCVGVNTNKHFESVEKVEKILEDTVT